MVLGEFADEGEGFFGIVLVGEGEGEFYHADAVIGVVYQHVIP